MSSRDCTPKHSFVTCLESAIDGTRFPAHREMTLHEGRPLWVRYDLEAVRAEVDRGVWAKRAAGLWRYRELLPLPLDREPVSLHETMTPLVPCPRLADELGIGELWIKDESRLPTGSFKDRGMALAVNMALLFGRHRLIVPTNGNAGGSLAAYAAAAGMEAWVFLPADTPRPNIEEAALAGARVFRVDGFITDCGKVVREIAPAIDAFDVSTLKEPYRIEGKKTMGLELAEQLDGVLPDVIVYPTGGGTGLIGMWKAFAELRELGWLRSENSPRMIAVQSDGCAPITRAWERGERFAEPWQDARSRAAGIRVPAAVGDFMILDAVRESRGCSLAVADGRILGWQARLARATGLSICPEGGACLGAILELLARGEIRRTDRVVLFNTAAAAKYEPARDLAGFPAVDPRRPALEQIELP